MLGYFLQHLALHSLSQLQLLALLLGMGLPPLQSQHQRAQQGPGQCQQPAAARVW